MSKNKKKSTNQSKTDMPLFIGSNVSKPIIKSVTKKNLSEQSKKNSMNKNNQHLWKILAWKKIIFFLFVIFIIAVVTWFVCHPEKFQSFIQLSEKWTSTHELWLMKHTSELLIIPVIFIIVLGLLAAKFIYQKTISFATIKELTENDNPAVGLYLAGFLFGITLALLGSLSGSEKDPMLAIYNILLALVIAIPLMRLSAWLQSIFLLYKFSIAKEIEKDRNLGTSAICCGGFIATGLIIRSSFIGESTNWESFFISIFSTYIIGQIVFFLGAWLFTKCTSYDFYAEIENRDNISAGIIMGSFLIGLGLVVSANIDNINFHIDITNITLATFWMISKPLLYAMGMGIFGIILLLSVGILTSRAIFPKISIDDEVRQKNSAVSLMIATIYITIGLIIQSLL